MTIKDIIEKLEGDLEPRKRLHINAPHNYCQSPSCLYIENLLKWIKSNLEEEQAKYGKDEDDYFESKIAEERENQG